MSARSITGPDASVAVELIRDAAPVRFVGSIPYAARICDGSYPHGVHGRVAPYSYAAGETVAE